MARVRLNGGYYVARSLIVSAQRCLNLYPELVPQQQGEQVQVVDYPTPGLRALSTPPTSGAGRCLYMATSGDLYGVVGNSVYYITPSWVFTLLGTIAVGANPVSMQDNGTDLLIADGTSNSYQIHLATKAFSSAPITDYNGADRLDTVDTYILGNVPDTRTFFSSDSNALTFDPLWIANKSGYPDDLVCVVVVNREIWLMGAQTCELWIDAGNADFPFQIMPGPFIQHGVGAKYSVAKQGQEIFWLSQDAYGNNICMLGKGYDAGRISTHAIEAAWGKYSTTSDAVGFCYQQGGHQFYMLSFPTADKTWCYDVQSSLWHERAWSDTNGVEHRHRAGCAAFAYNVNVVADWETGALYALDQEVFDDVGAPIVRRRCFPHMTDDGDRVLYAQFIADVAAGADLVTGTPLILLSWSDDRGMTYGNPISGSLGAMGEYLTSVQWQRLGLGRDRVFSLSWADPVKTALQGAWITSKKLGS